MTKNKSAREDIDFEWKWGALSLALRKSSSENKKCQSKICVNREKRASNLKIVIIKKSRDRRKWKVTLIFESVILSLKSTTMIKKSHKYLKSDHENEKFTRGRGEIILILKTHRDIEKHTQSLKSSTLILKSPPWFWYSKVSCDW